MLHKLGLCSSVDDETTVSSSGCIRTENCLPFDCGPTFHDLTIWFSISSMHSLSKNGWIAEDKETKYLANQTIIGRTQVDDQLVHP